MDERFDSPGGYPREFGRSQVDSNRGTSLNRSVYIASLKNSDTKSAGKSSRFSSGQRGTKLSPDSVKERYRRNSTESNNFGVKTHDGKLSARENPMLDITAKLGSSSNQLQNSYLSRGEKKLNELNRRIEDMNYKIYSSSRPSQKIGISANLINPKSEYIPVTPGKSKYRKQEDFILECPWSDDLDLSSLSGLQLVSNQEPE